MSRIIRLIAACLALAAVSAVALAEPIPAPRFPSGNVIKNGEFTGGLRNWTITNASSGDKVKCNGVGHNSDCALQLKNGASSPVTTVKQVYKPAATSSTDSVLIFGEAYVRNVSGSSCLKFTVKTFFKNGTSQKDSYKTCGGSFDDWNSTHGIGESTSFSEKSMLKTVFTITHKGKGTWLVDSVTLEWEDK